MRKSNRQQTTPQAAALFSPESVAGQILIVDDHRQARESMADVLRAAGHQVESTASASEALNQLDEESFDCIVTDLQMPGMSGLEFIHHLGRLPHGAQILMVTAHATVASAVDAMRHGAFDYIEKPFDADQLERLVSRAIEHGRQQDASTKLPNFGASGATMIGSSAAMKSLRMQIAQVSRTSETVLIVGESGTGKELVARAIHAASSRSQAPLVSLNCPVLSAQLMESELFGHERGAFTGAEGPRTGRFELADQGTILLDEVTEIDLALQAKLLRVLQEKSFERVGCSVTTYVDVRVLATSNRNLQAEIAAGRFREDLYYRLAVVPLAVPSLRDRRDDIPDLIAHFLLRSAQRLQRNPCELQPGAVELLCECQWPGNVRELENIISRASVLNVGGPITADELRGWLSLHGSTSGARGERSESSANENTAFLGKGMACGLSLETMERKLIEATLERFGGHRAKTAQALGIGLRTLSGKIKEYGYAPRTKVFTKAA
ncbi:MAG TPA: sigma-54 dependent transcriptional regulator [Pirellulales bacterium]|jgi:DNA-binding NtrC family response regulator|nr:sigma-54 dependent transcriptional regulator [Pirellulales bacterium]